MNVCIVEPSGGLHRTVDALLEESATRAMRGRFIDSEMEYAKSLYLTARLIAPSAAAREWPTFWQWAGMLWAASLRTRRYGAR